MVYNHKPKESQTIVWVLKSKFEISNANECER